MFFGASGLFVSLAQERQAVAQAVQPPASLVAVALVCLQASSPNAQCTQALCRLARCLTIQSTGHAPASRVMPVISNVRRQRITLSDSTAAVVVFDFASRFPHKFWISSWAKDEQYPHGFRYKLLSVRPEPEGLIELVVLVEQFLGEKSEMTRLNISPSAFNRTAATFTDGLAEEYNLNFEELDLSNVRTEQHFQEAVMAAGWQEWSVQ